MATILVHIALVAYAAAAAAYLSWLVRPRERLVSAGRALLFAGLLLHLTSFAAAASLSHGEGLARAGFGSDAWKGGQLFSLLAAAVAPVTVAVMVPAHLVHSGTRAIAPELTHSSALAVHVFSAAAGTAALALAFALSLLYLASEKQLKSKQPGRLFARLPSLELIDRVGWHLSVWGFVFLSVAIATGSLVSHEASGSAFPIAPKQGFAVLAWALLAGLIQARLVAGWRGRRLALLVVAGFLLLIGTYAGLLAAPQHASAAAAALLAPGRG